MDTLTTSEHNTDDMYPALEAIVIVFSPIRHAQTELEASSKPTIMKFIPILEYIKLKIIQYSSGMRDNHPKTFEPPSTFTQELSKRTLEVLNNIQYHEFWCLACFLHPGLMSFNFFPRSIFSQCRSAGESLARKMVNNCEKNVPENGTTERIDQISSRISFDNDDLGISKWSLSNKMSFISTPERAPMKYRHMLHYL